MKSKHMNGIKIDTSLSASSLMESPLAVNTSDDQKEEKSPYNENEKKSYLDDGFVFGLEGSGIERPKGKVASIVVEGDSIETQPYQVAMVITTFTTQLSFIATSINEMYAIGGSDMISTLLQSLAIVFSSWVMADFGTGVLHWSVDNYGNGRTPIMGSIIAAFQGHHSAPWTITERGFCNNVHKLCIPFGIPTILLISAITGPKTTLFFTTFCIFVILSQEFHKWSHLTKSEVSPWINQLQSMGLIIGRREHALHHKAPYEGNYCIISGVCNKALDESGFFRRLEHIVYNMNGVESNAWKLDADLRKRTLEGDYELKLTER